MSCIPRWLAGVVCLVVLLMAACDDDVGDGDTGDGSDGDGGGGGGNPVQTVIEVENNTFFGVDIDAQFQNSQQQDLQFDTPLNTPIAPNELFSQSYDAGENAMSDFQGTFSVNAQPPTDFRLTGAINLGAANKFHVVETFAPPAAPFFEIITDQEYMNRQNP